MLDTSHDATLMISEAVKRDPFTVFGINLQRFKMAGERRTVITGANVLQMFYNLKYLSLQRALLSA